MHREELWREIHAERSGVAEAETSPDSQDAFAAELTEAAYPIALKYGVLGSSLDLELGESVYANYNFDKKTYTKVSADNYQQQVKLLQEAKQKSPELKICSLDYADPADDDAIKEIYKTERANGFTPYVATIGLDRVIQEPETP